MGRVTPVQAGRGQRHHGQLQCTWEWAVCRAAGACGCGAGQRGTWTPPKGQVEGAGACVLKIPPGWEDEGGLPARGGTGREGRRLSWKCEQALGRAWWLVAGERLRGPAAFREGSCKEGAALQVSESTEGPSRGCGSHRCV